MLWGSAARSFEGPATCSRDPQRLAPVNNYRSLCESLEVHTVRSWKRLISQPSSSHLCRLTCTGWLTGCQVAELMLAYRNEPPAVAGNGMKYQVQLLLGPMRHKGIDEIAGSAHSPARPQEGIIVHAVIACKRCDSLSSGPSWICCATIQYVYRHFGHDPPFDPLCHFCLHIQCTSVSSIMLSRCAVPGSKEP